MPYPPRLHFDSIRSDVSRRLPQIFCRLLAFLGLFLLIVHGRLSTASAENTPPAGTKAELVLFDFGDANDKPIRDAAIARFNKRYPNVKVTDQFTPITSWPDYIDKLVTQIASGKAPDLIHIATEGALLTINKKARDSTRRAHQFGCR
jgi:ABC-type glycerol-3-phosphate transport system substrate-binding protein